MMLGMLAPASLAAFSAGAALAGFGHPRPVQGVRTVRGADEQPVAPVPQGRPPAPGAVDATPNRTLPRGSLLDLSV
jgi:hypothetical protein